MSTTVAVCEGASRIAEKKAAVAKPLPFSPGLWLNYSKTHIAWICPRVSGQDKPI